MDRAPIDLGCVTYEVDLEDVTYKDIDIGEILDGSLSSSWFAKDKRVERCEDGRSRLLSSQGGPKLQRAWFSGREWVHGCYLPMPRREELDVIERETRDLEMEGGPGPHAKKWLERVGD